jgi:hypothetical protein
MGACLGNSQDDVFVRREPSLNEENAEFCVRNSLVVSFKWMFVWGDATSTRWLQNGVGAKRTELR